MAIFFSLTKTETIKHMFVKQLFKYQMIRNELELEMVP